MRQIRRLFLNERPLALLLLTLTMAFLAQTWRVLV